ncbi:MAG: ATP-binding protein [Candidatus Latescibacteria bacterium]|jgi:PAS domain S-box-containing protein|nr:ATP-binding protein [Candidatus Latescibacterota bacterium]
MATAADYSASILEGLAEGIVAFDDEGCVVMANAYLVALIGLAGQTPIGKSAETLFADRPEILRILRDGFEKKELASHTDLVHHNADGALQHLRVSTSFLDAAGQLGLVLVVRDVSELKKMEWEIFQVEKMTALGRLAASVAHEVRNPLGAIDIQLQLLEEDLGDLASGLGKRFLERLNIAQTEMKRIDRIVQNFLRFSRTPKLRLRQLSLNDVVRHVFELVSPEARERKIQVRLELFEDLPVINGDEDQLGQAVLNMTINAFQSMASGGELIARTQVESSQVCLTLSDTGCGIPEEEVDRIFEFYYTTKDEGTGLGLSIAQRIIYQHGGHIDVESRPGLGTTFRIYWPILQEENTRKAI